MSADQETPTVESQEPNQMGLGEADQIIHKYTRLPLAVRNVTPLLKRLQRSLDLTTISRPTIGLANLRGISRLASNIVSRFPQVSRKYEVQSPPVDPTGGAGLVLAGVEEPQAGAEGDTAWFEKMPSFDEVLQRIQMAKTSGGSPAEAPAQPAASGRGAVQRAPSSRATPPAAGTQDWLERMPSFDEVLRRMNAAKAASVGAPAEAASQPPAAPSTPPIQRATTQPPQGSGQVTRTGSPRGRRIFSRVEEVSPDGSVTSRSSTPAIQTRPSEANVPPASPTSLPPQPEASSVAAEPHPNLVEPAQSQQSPSESSQAEEQISANLRLEPPPRPETVPAHPLTPPAPTALQRQPESKTIVTPSPHQVATPANAEKHEARTVTARQKPGVETSAGQEVEIATVYQEPGVETSVGQGVETATARQEPGVEALAGQEAEAITARQEPGVETLAGPPGSTQSPVVEPSIPIEESRSSSKPEISTHPPDKGLAVQRHAEPAAHPPLEEDVSPAAPIQRTPAEAATPVEVEAITPVQGKDVPPVEPESPTFLDQGEAERVGRIETLDKPMLQRQPELAERPAQQVRKQEDVQGGSGSPTTEPLSTQRIQSSAPQPETSQPSEAAPQRQSEPQALPGRSDRIELPAAATEPVSPAITTEQPARTSFQSDEPAAFETGGEPATAQVGPIQRSLADEEQRAVKVEQTQPIPVETLAPLSMPAEVSAPAAGEPAATKVEQAQSIPAEASTPPSPERAEPGSGSAAGKGISSSQGVVQPQRETAPIAPANLPQQSEPPTIEMAEQVGTIQAVVDEHRTSTPVQVESTGLVGEIETIARHAPPIQRSPAEASTLVELSAPADVSTLTKASTPAEVSTPAEKERPALKAEPGSKPAVQRQTAPKTMPEEVVTPTGPGETLAIESFRTVFETGSPPIASMPSAPALASFESERPVETDGSPAGSEQGGPVQRTAAEAITPAEAPLAPLSEIRPAIPAVEASARTTQTEPPASPSARSSTPHPAIQRRPERGEPQPEQANLQPTGFDQPETELGKVILARAAASARVPLIEPAQTLLSTPAKSEAPARLPQVRIQRRPDKTRVSRFRARSPLPLAAPKRIEVVVSDRQAQSNGETMARNGSATPVTPPAAAVVQRQVAESWESPPPVEPGPDLIQRAMGEDTAEEAESGRAKLDQLARQIYPLIKRMLAIERERGA